MIVVVVIVGVIVFDVMLTVVAEPIVPFATRFRVIRSPDFAYEEFALLLVIVNVVILSGFASTVTVLFIESGMLPAASDVPSYVITIDPGVEVSMVVGVKETVPTYDALFSSDMVAPSSEYWAFCNSVTAASPISAITGFIVSTMTNLIQCHRLELLHLYGVY